MSMKSMILEVGRWVVVFAMLVSLLWMFGGNGVSSADVSAVAEAVTAQLDMENMVLADNQMVKRLYGLDPSAFEGCILYYPTTNMMAEELLIVKLSDLSQQEMVRAAAEKRLETQKTTFDGYGVEQYAMLTEHSVIAVRGNFVLFLVNGDSDAGQKAFRDAL